VDVRDRNVGGYVAEARRLLEERLTLPAGYRLEWSGQFEAMERANRRLQVVVPITLAIIFLLLYFQFGNATESLVVMLSLPFALVGGVWLMWLLDYNLSVATGIGFIALAGVAAETGVVAAPMVGGMVSSTLLTLLVIPAIYSLWKERELRRTAGPPLREEIPAGAVHPAEG
jgi:Cu/Ag efflux pump CusA